jgi:hypothetical protein
LTTTFDEVEDGGARRIARRSRRDVELVEQEREDTRRAGRPQIAVCDRLHRPVDADLEIGRAQAADRTALAIRHHGVDPNRG